MSGFLRNPNSFMNTVNCIGNKEQQANKCVLKIIFYNRLLRKGYFKSKGRIMFVQTVERAWLLVQCVTTVNVLLLTKYYDVIK